jgi:hypothetical protein
MKNRQRFATTLRGGRTDRPPLFSEGIRRDVIRTWRKQGLGNRSLESLITVDQYEMIGPELDPIPYPVRWPTDLHDLTDFRRRLDPLDKHRYPRNWLKKYRSLTERDIVTFMEIHQGFFLSMGVAGWESFEDVIGLLGTNPALVEAVLELFAEFSCRIAEYVLQKCPVDAVYFSEPIGGGDRPLMSPEMYKKIVLRSYLRVIDVIKKFGVHTIVFLTYGNIRPLLKPILEAGFNCIWCCESNVPEMDYRAIRQMFGADLGLIGGIDLDCLREGKRSIDLELKKKLPVLLEQGNYIPLADGRIRTDVTFENYLYYREKLSALVIKG